MNEPIAEAVLAPRADLIRRLWEAQLEGHRESASRLMAEAAQMLEENPKCVWCGKADCFSVLPKPVPVAVAEADNAGLVERDAARYRVLRRSVLQAPMSAGFELMTTEADIDAQCDQIAMKGSL